MITSDTAFQDIVQLNLMLLEKLRKEEWEVFATLSQDYCQAIEAVIARAQQEAAAGKKEGIAQLIITLQANEAEIAQRLQHRMRVLKENMLKLQQGKKSCQHYAAQMPRRFF